MLRRGRHVREALAIVIATIVLGGCFGGRAADGSATPHPTPGGFATNAADPSADASPSAEDSPEPTPTPDPAVLQLRATGCPGGAVLEWSPSTHRNFHHYTALRSPEEEIATDYPPIAPAVDWGETYAVDPFVTSAVDASILPSAKEWNYRVMAYDILNDIVSASGVASARIFDVLSLGTPTVEADGALTRIGWTAFDGDAACFTSYRVLFGVGRPPSVLLSEVSDMARTSIETDTLHAGTTYQLRIDAVRSTTLGSFVAARSETVIYTVP